MKLLIGIPGTLIFTYLIFLFKMCKYIYIYMYIYIYIYITLYYIYIYIFYIYLSYVIYIHIYIYIQVNIRNIAFSDVISLQITWKFLVVLSWISLILKLSKIFSIQISHKSIIHFGYILWHSMILENVIMN